MGEYTDIVFCHCHRDSLMLPQGNCIYRCSHCPTSVQLFREVAPPEWYSAEVMRSDQFPLCLECGKNMIGTGVCVFEEDGKHYEIIGFACKANDVHPKRKLGGYGRTPSEETYNEVRGEVQQTLIDWAIEGRAMNTTHVQDISIADATKLLFDVMLNSPTRSEDGTRTIDIAPFSPSDQELCKTACQYYANHSLIHSLVIDGTRISFRPDALLSNRLAELQQSSTLLN